MPGIRRETPSGRHPNDSIWASYVENDFEVSNVTRLLRAVVVALALLQNPGCGDDGERRDDALRTDGDRAIRVVRPGMPSREAEPSPRTADDSNPATRASAPTADEVRDAREVLRDSEDPRLETTLDPEASAERVQQTQRLDAGGDDLETVLDTLASDPDPAVRVAAADLLAESERGEAIDGLLQALGDPSREVILQVLETLALVGERDIVPSVEPFLDHADADIRDAAEDTLYFVGDSDES